MRHYHSKSHRVIGRDAVEVVEVEGTWSGVQGLAIALLVLLPLVARSPLGLGLIAVGAVALFVFPARRRVRLDGRRRVLAIDHAGFFREQWTREIPFDELGRLVLQRSGRKGGQPLFSAFARTSAGRVYLFSHAGEAETAALEQDASTVLEGARPSDR
jgi:hypothetical protein